MSVKKVLCTVDDVLVHTTPRPWDARPGKLKVPVYSHAADIQKDKPSGSRDEPVNIVCGSVRDSSGIAYVTDWRGTSEADAALITRAVNTFEAARNALHEALLVCDGHRGMQSRTIIAEALAYMEEEVPAQK